MIFVGQLFWIRNIVAAIVIILGLVGIKDFLFFKEGISFSIPDSYKSKYYQQVRNVFRLESLIPMISATAVMALGISLIELPCRLVLLLRPEYMENILGIIITFTASALLVASVYLIHKVI